MIWLGHMRSEDAAGLHGLAPSHTHHFFVNAITAQGCTVPLWRLSDALNALLRFQFPPRASFGLRARLLEFDASSTTFTDVQWPEDVSETWTSGDRRVVSAVMAGACLSGVAAALNDRCGDLLVGGSLDPANLRGVPMVEMTFHDHWWTMHWQLPICVYPLLYSRWTWATCVSVSEDGSFRSPPWLTDAPTLSARSFRRLRHAACLGDLTMESALTYGARILHNVI